MADSSQQPEQNPLPESDAGEAAGEASPSGGESTGGDVEQGLAEAQESVQQMQGSVDTAAGGEAAGGDTPTGGGAEPASGASEAEAGDGTTGVAMPDFESSGGRADRGIELLGDVDLDVSVELGRSEMLVEDVLRLSAGSVVELDKLAGDPVDVYVNGRLVARGEVLVLNDNFCIRVSEIVADLEEEADIAQQQHTDS